MKNAIPLVLILTLLIYLPAKSQITEKCLSDEKREQIKAELIQNAQSLIESGKLRVDQRNAVLLEWPLKQTDGYNDPGYYAITNYVDQDNSSGIQDYNCGARTYNGHRGIDIMLWPYRWQKQDNDEVEIIASAPGIIIGKDDGNFDKNCDCSDPNWNAVYVQHGDGSVAWYGHMKENSLTSKGIGETVEVGEFLGIVGSSGCSTDPHLHFELYANQLQTILVEPFAGDCNSYNGNTTWWTDQKPYREPRINRLMTHFDAPEQNFGCPGDNDVINESNAFSPGDKVYFSANYQDQIVFNSTNYSIYKPDNSLWENWSHFSSETYSVSWWYWSLNLPNNAQEGTWTFEAVYDGVTYTHDFTVGEVVSVENSDGLPNIEIFPNPFSNHINIENIGNEEVQIEIYSSDNKKVLSINRIQIETLTIPTNNLAKGIYFLKLTIKNQEIIKKILKM